MRVDVSPQPSVRRVEEQSKSKDVKCRHNDRAACNRGESCFFYHSKVVCRIFSRYGECENQDKCFKRHPVGICAKWRKGKCDKDLDCLYRHPVDLQESPSRSHKSPDRADGRGTRKRRLSSQQEENCKSARLINSENNQDHFLVQKYKELQQQVDNIQMKKENVPQGWMNQTWVRAPVPQQIPVMPIQSQATHPTLNPAQLPWNQPPGRVQPIFHTEQHQGQSLGQFPVLFH